MAPHAAENPMMVMVDKSTGNKYLRSVDQKGLEQDGDKHWLVKDMHRELKSWGYPGGGTNALMLKSGGKPATVAVREALARCHGGRATPEPTCWGTSDRRHGRRSRPHHSRPGPIPQTPHPIEDGRGRLTMSPSCRGSSCLLYTSPSPRDQRGSRMPSSA